MVVSCEIQSQKKREVAGIHQILFFRGGGFFKQFIFQVYVMVLIALYGPLRYISGGILANANAVLNNISFVVEVAKNLL